MEITIEILTGVIIASLGFHIWQAIRLTEVNRSLNSSNEERDDFSAELDSLKKTHEAAVSSIKTTHAVEKADFEQKLKHLETSLNSSEPNSFEPNQDY